MFDSVLHPDELPPQALLKDRKPSTGAPGTQPEVVGLGGPSGAEYEAYLRDDVAYKGMLEQLLKSKPGQFVALFEGSLVDSDGDVVELTRRVEERWPHDFVLIRQVAPESSDTVESPEE